MAGPLHDIRVEEQDLSSADLTIEARTGESLEIIARGIASGADEEVVEETVGETMTLAYQSDDGDDEVFPEPVLHNQHMDVLGVLREMGYNLPTTKVPEGDTFTMTDPGGNANATVYYREADAGVWNARSDGGPRGRRRVYITGGQVTDSIASSSTEVHPVDTSVNPAQLDDWPWEEDVRADREYDVVAVMASADNSDGANITLNGLRFVSEETEFFARSSAFIDPLNFQYPSDELDTVPFVFPEPVTFGPGDDLTVEYQATNANTMSAENAIVNVGLICLRRDVGA